MRSGSVCSRLVRSSPGCLWPWFAGAARAAEECLECHEYGRQRRRRRASGRRRDDVGRRPSHGAAGASCADCHAGKAEYPHAADDPRAACTNCHEDADGGARRERPPGRPGARAKRPDCADCHGDAAHDGAGLRPKPPWCIPKRLAQTCGKCHSNPELGAQAGIKLVQPLAAYEASVHAGGVARGEHAATCSDCHGSHGILPGRRRAVAGATARTCPRPAPPATPRSPRPTSESVHGVAAAAGIGESPVCTDCHGEHRILGPADQGSPVFASNVPKMTCGRCHGDLRVTEKFGMKNDRRRRPSRTASTASPARSGTSRWPTAPPATACTTSCRPPTRARTSTPANLAATCGSCHPGRRRDASRSAPSTSCRAARRSSSSGGLLDADRLPLADRADDRRHAAAQRARLLPQGARVPASCAVCRVSTTRRCA